MAGLDPATHAVQPARPPTIPTVLDASGLQRRFGSGADGFVLHLDRIRIEPGAAIAVTGPSGCGKSTLLGLLSLALKPTGADPDAALNLAGTDALALWTRGQDDALTGLRAATLGFVPQTAALLGFLSLRENITLPQAITGRRDPAYIDELSSWLGITHVLTRRPAQVSVGQRQRAAIARALAHRPALVLADEPTAAVHPGQAAEIMAALRDLARHTGTALVVTTHDPARAEAADFAIAPCEPTGPGATRFAWAA